MRVVVLCAIFSMSLFSEGGEVVSTDVNATVVEHSAVLPEKPSDEESRVGKKRLEKMGIEDNGGKIVIDTVKMREYFEKVGIAVSKSLEGTHEKLKKEEKDMDPGVRTYDGKIEIDINKTKKFMEIWSNAFEEFGRELGKSIENIE